MLKSLVRRCSVVLLGVGFCWAPAVWASEEAGTQAERSERQAPLVFLFSPPNKPPFWYFEADQPRGILYDLLSEVAAERGIAMDAEVISRKRGDFQVQDHNNKLVARALEWVPDPEAYAYTDPVIASPDVFISLRSDALSVEQVIEGEAGRLVGTHIGYVYPLLEPYFSSGQLTRSDAVSELAMLERVLKERTTVTFMARPVARWYIRSNQWQKQFFLSEPVDAGYRLRLFFNPQQQEFVTFFNQRLEQMRRDGRWQEIVDRYQ